MEDTNKLIKSVAIDVIKVTSVLSILGIYNSVIQNRTCDLNNWYLYFPFMGTRYYCPIKDVISIGSITGISFFGLHFMKKYM